MARLPQPGSDDGEWGQILNEYLSVSHAPTGVLKPGSVVSSTIVNNSVNSSKLSATSPSNGQALVYDSSVGGGLSWQTVAGSSSDTNLSATATPTDVTVVSDTGTDAVLTAADGTRAGVMTAAMQTKLANIATGATLNSTDATLLSRANHTGTQAISTVANLQATLDDKAPTKNRTVSSTSPATDFLDNFEVSDDASSTSAWPNRWSITWISGAVTRVVAKFGKFGEYVGTPAKPDVTPFSLYTKESQADTDQTADMMVVADAKDATNKLWRITAGAAQVLRRTDSDSEARISSNFIGTLATTSRNLLETSINSTLKSWLNEWGALRGTSPYSWGDSLVRGVRSAGDGITSGNFIEISDRRTATTVVPYGRKWANGDLVRNGVTLSDCYLCAPGMTKDTDPNVASLPAGTLIFERL